jgi:hypothetical protein
MLAGAAMDAAHPVGVTTQWRNDMKKNHAIQSLAGIAAGTVLALMVSTAISGEITGNGKSLQIAPHTLNGNSECAFSGRQDDPATALDQHFKGTVAQSWGQLTKTWRNFLTSIGVSPGISCNPTTPSGEPV